MEEKKDFKYEEIITSPKIPKNKKEEINEELKAHYMIDTRKQYNLASNKDSIEAYKTQQINELTKILIMYKSEYDNLIRQRIKKTEDSIELEKKIKMLEKVDNQIQKKLQRAKSLNDIIKSSVINKKGQKDELIYEKQTLTNLISKIKNDIYVINKQTSLLDKKTESLEKDYFKEKINEKDVILETNNVYSKILEQNKKNAFEKNEQDLTLKFYNTIIEQKSSFLKISDEKDMKQKKIEEKQSKENTDKMEIEGRKTLFLLKLYNKFLKIKMSRLLKKNEKLENAYEKLRDIYGTSDLNYIVDEMINRERYYQLKIKNIKNLEIKIDNLKRNIKKKENIIKSVSQNYGSFDNEKLINLKKPEQENLINKENELENKLKELNELNGKISVKYDNVKNNIIKMCKDFNNKNKELLQTNIYTNEIEDPSLDTKNSIIEDNIIENNYNEFLKNLDKKLEGLFLCHSKQEFLQIMRQKGNKLNPFLETNFKILPKKLNRQKSDIMISSSSSSTNRDFKNEKGNIFNSNFLKEKNIQNNIFTHFLKDYKQKLMEESGVDFEKNKILKKKDK